MDAMGSTRSVASLVTAWCNGLQSSCARLQSNVDNLQASVTQRRVISTLSSNFASFLEDVNDQVSSVTADLEFLETMTTDTLSFEELLANCTELYKQTEAGISVLETQLVQYGYIPVDKAEAPKSTLEMLEGGLLWQENGKDSCKLEESAPRKATTFCPLLPTELVAATPLPSAFVVSSKLNANNKEDFDLISFSKLSLEELGISATSLSAIASSDLHGDESCLTATPPELKPYVEMRAEDDASNFSDTSLKQPSNPSWILQSEHEQKKNLAAAGSLPRFVFAEDGTDRKLPAASVSSSKPEAIQNAKENFLGSGTVSDLRLLEPVERGQYDKAPDFLKSQVSLKDLNEAITVINKIMVTKQEACRQESAECNPVILNQEDVKLLSPESKVRPILLLLLRLNRIIRHGSLGTYRASCAS